MLYTEDFSMHHYVGFSQIGSHITRELLSRFLLNLVCRVAYIEGIKYVNLIEIGPVVIEI